MTAMTPAQFAALVDAVLDPVGLARARTRIVEEYAWLYGAAHSGIVRERGRTSGGAVSDPTTSVAVGYVASSDRDHESSDDRRAPQAILRQALEHAGVAIVGVENDLKGLESALRRWHGRHDSRGILDPPAEMETVRYRRTVSNDELEASREAQRRRAQRGEAIA